MHYYIWTGDLFHNKSWLAATKKSLQRNMKVRFCILSIYRYIYENIGFYMACTTSSE